jgi:hypothetical protein
MRTSYAAEAGPRGTDAQAEAKMIARAADTLVIRIIDVWSLARGRRLKAASRQLVVFSL